LKPDQEILLIRLFVVRGGGHARLGGLFGAMVAEGVVFNESPAERWGITRM